MFQLIFAPKTTDFAGLALHSPIVMIKLNKNHEEMHDYLCKTDMKLIGGLDYGGTSDKRR